MYYTSGALAELANINSNNNIIFKTDQMRKDWLEDYGDLLYQLLKTAGKKYKINDGLYVNVAYNYYDNFGISLLVNVSDNENFTFDTNTTIHNLIDYIKKFHMSIDDLEAKTQQFVHDWVDNANELIKDAGIKLPMFNGYVYYDRYDKLFYVPSATIDGKQWHIDVNYEIPQYKVNFDNTYIFD